MLGSAGFNANLVEGLDALLSCSELYERQRFWLHDMGARYPTGNSVTGSGSE
jgi:hypothetical protein